MVVGQVEMGEGLSICGCGDTEYGTSYGLEPPLCCNALGPRKVDRGGFDSTRMSVADVAPYAPKATLA